MRLPTLLAPALLAAAFALAVPASADGTAPASDVVDRVVAVVGHDIVLLSDLRARERPFLQALDAAATGDADRAQKRAALDKDLLDKLVVEALEARLANALHISVTPADIDRGVQGVAQQQGLDLPSLVAKAREEGLSEAELRAEVGRQILEAELMELKVLPRVRRNPTMTEAQWTLALTRARSEWLEELKKATYVDVRL